MNALALSRKGKLLKDTHRHKETNHMNNKIIYQAFFIGVRSFVYSPKFAKIQSAQNWITRNRHRVVEDLQIIKYNPSDRSQTEWFNDTGNKYSLSFRATPQTIIKKAIALEDELQEANK